MGREFRVGDRVRAYNMDGDALVTLDGEVIEVQGDLIRVQRGIFHRKQCRRLVKKGPRDWWANLYEDDGGLYGYMYPTKEKADEASANGDGTMSRLRLVHVREVRAKRAEGKLA